MDEGREDILQYADGIFHPVTEGADLWIHPGTGEALLRCPFLRKVRNQADVQMHDLRHPANAVPGLP